jgi:diaminopimelate epimerase
VKIPFTKMHGLGNDFVVIYCREGAVSDRIGPADEFSRNICHRRFGIGADQVLLLYPSSIADFRMLIYNADGSEVEMCGNGIRCFAKYIWDRGLSEKAALEVETLAGIIRPERAGQMVKVDMGEPVFEGRLIPVNLDGLVKDFPLKIDDKEFTITAVSMGNPHAVVFVGEVAGFDVGRYGPKIENHGLFPKRTNVEFVEVLDSGNIRMRVWERGAGETMACGTGASAAGVVSSLKGLTGRRVNVLLTGGELLIEWQPDNHVSMTGPAVEVFEGSLKTGDGYHG